MGQKRNEQINSLFIRLDKDYDLDLIKYFSPIDRNGRAYKAKELIRRALDFEKKVNEYIFHLYINKDGEKIKSPNDLTLISDSKNNSKFEIKLKKEELTKEEKKKILEKNLDKGI